MLSATVTYVDSLSFAKQEAQLNEVLSASNLDPTALTVVTRKLEVRFSDNKLLRKIMVFENVKNFVRREKNPSPVNKRFY